MEDPLSQLEMLATLNVGLKKGAEPHCYLPLFSNGPKLDTTPTLIGLSLEFLTVSDDLSESHHFCFRVLSIMGITLDLRNKRVTFFSPACLLDKGLSTTGKQEERRKNTFTMRICVVVSRQGAPRIKNQ